MDGGSNKLAKLERVVDLKDRIAEGGALCAVPSAIHNRPVLFFAIFGYTAGIFGAELSLP